MNIVLSGPRTQGSRAEMASLTATSPEDENALRILYELFHKIGSTEVLVSLSESTITEEKIKHISLLFE